MKKIAFKSFLQNYYLTNFFYEFIFAYAIYGALFIIRGLSVFQVSLLLSWWALTSAIFEVPSGALADRWSRKKMMVLAPLIKSFCFISWFLAKGNFYLYALGFLFWSLGSCFLSGTSEALLFDVLVYFKKDKEYEKFLGKKKAYLYLVVAISMITGGFMANFNLNFTIIFSVIPLLFSAFFATRICEAAKVKSTEEVHYFEYLKMAFAEVKNNKLLRYLFLYLFGISTLNGLEEFDQLYYQLVKLPLFGMLSKIWNLRAIYFSTSLFLLIFALWVFLSRKKILKDDA